LGKLFQFKFFEGFTLNLVLLGVVSMFTDLSSQMIFPVVPLYLTTVLGAGAAIVGVVEGAAETTAALLKMLSGFWSDKIRRRKPFVLFGYSLSALTKPLFAFAYSWGFVVFIRVIERIGKGIRDAPRDAIIADSVDERIRGKAYGFQRALDGLGSVLGAVLALVLLPVLGFKNLFLFAFFPGLVAIVAIFFIKEKKQLLSSENIKSEKKLSIKESFGLLSPNLKLFILISGVFSLANFGYAFLLLKAKNAGYSDEKAVLLYVLFYLAYTLCTIPMGVLSDKIGRRPLLIGGYMLFAITAFGLIFAKTLPVIIFFFVLYGIFFGMTDGVQRAFVVDLAPKNLKGTALGAFYTITGIVALPAGFILGTLWDKISPETTFIFAFAMGIISLVLFLFVKEGASSAINAGIVKNQGKL
jgi:MFS family permease